MTLQPNILFHNRYRLLSKLGRGSFGEVWHAKDEFTDLDIAIKIYIALDDLGQLEFRSEFKTVHDLSHPNILRPEHFDIVHNRPYLVMQLCNGSIENKVGNMNEDDIWHLIKDIASGLSYLHSKEVIHRDIKPDNILLSSSDEYLLSDFGVSAKMQNTMRRNSTRQKIESDISGTVAYMAPELFSKNPIANKATDIWALGATLYELLTGELLFLGQGGILQLKGAEIPDLPNKYSDDIKALVLACIRLDATVRPTSSELAKYAEAKTNGYICKPSWSENNTKPIPLLSWKYILISISSIILTILVVLIISNKNEITDDNPITRDENIVHPISTSEQNNSRDNNLLNNENDREDRTETNEAGIVNDDSEVISTRIQPIHEITTNEISDNVLDLGYGKWHGGTKDGKPHGKGSIDLYQSHNFNGVQAQAGYRLEGQFNNGILVIGKLYDCDNNIIKTIMP